MENNFRLQICKNIINYLLESTNYTLKDIAALLNCSIRQLRSIYFDELMPTNLYCERDLVRLYHLILELNTNKQYVHQGYKWGCL
ncbi:TPA: hypothetical protein JA346_07810 [Legionella pneumophila]|uniref:HTH araC/xylS-type domain-containing protein n=1 Tax=Legionella fallonii LLAP-10 TaxID=1212491 RepID=A0A098G6N4_9GAMM|nr:hypothetical protein [Legionella fallonii]HAT8111938.1 hypothetical protein [Legionella pneumophila]HAT9086284.1 hypothetical protein [Legionella pneumophila subsp. pneumophila]CEG57641.1 protein of unknown function [Legionella fallonii LLAP-10]HAT8116531.1 hypothetical protein [Legionella pneumophila]HAT8130789.1 hypothetical protein [Legionella pneumophila]